MKPRVSLPPHTATGADSIVWGATAAKMRYACIRVDERPSIQALVAPSPIIASEIDQAMTPLPSTPEVASPDVGGARTTEDETNGHLTDKRNEYQAIMANRIMFNDEDWSESREAASRAYLVRGRGDAILGVEVLCGDPGLDFKELLGSMRGLCVLAKARGIPGELPWHLAVAKKAAAELKGIL